MKVAIDDWNWKLKVDFTDKVGGAFATGGGQTGGKEHVVISLILFMLNNRMIVAGPLYQDAEGDDKWSNRRVDRLAEQLFWEGPAYDGYWIVLGITGLLVACNRLTWRRGA